MERKYKVGDKVVPHSKSVTWGNDLFTLKNCVEWKEAKRKNQPFLYVSHWNEYEQAYALTHDNRVFSGNYYKETDLTSYKDNKKQESESLIIETQPHIETKLYNYDDGSSDVANVHIEADTKKVIYSGTTTIVILSDGSKGVAKTSPEDVFDKKKGYQIALRRAYLKRLQKELKELTK